EIPERNYSSLTNHLFSYFMDRCKHSSNAALFGVIGNRTVGNRKMSFFYKSVAIDLEQDVVIPGCWPTKKGPIDKWFEDVPDFRPALGCGSSKCPVGMFISRYWNIWIIVELDILRSPPKQLRKTVREEHLKCSPQRLRP